MGGDRYRGLRPAYRQARLFLKTLYHIDEEFFMREGFETLKACKYAMAVKACWYRIQIWDRYKMKTVFLQLQDWIQFKNQ